MTILLAVVWMVFFLSSYALRDLHSFPTRRSSDLVAGSGTNHSALRYQSGSVLRMGAGVEGLSSVSQGLVLTNLIFLVSRSEEHTSELQSQSNLVCRLLLEKKN